MCTHVCLKIAMQLLDENVTKLVFIYFLYSYSESHTLSYVILHEGMRSRVGPPTYLRCIFQKFYIQFNLLLSRNRAIDNDYCDIVPGLLCV